MPNKIIKGLAYTSDGFTFPKGRKNICVECYRQVGTAVDIAIFVVVAVIVGLIIYLAAPVIWGALGSSAELG